MQDPGGNGRPASASVDDIAPPSPETVASDSLRGEALAAAGAVAAHIRNVTATAKTEAELSIASLVFIVVAAITSLLLVVTAWLCLVAAAIWWAVENGLSIGAALLIAGTVHLVVVLMLLLWSKSLLSKIGFSRTRRLVFPGSGEPE